jgi:hypothetical protein
MREVVKEMVKEMAKRQYELGSEGLPLLSLSDINDLWRPKLGVTFGWAEYAPTVPSNSSGEADRFDDVGIGEKGQWKSLSWAAG